MRGLPCMTRLPSVAIRPPSLSPPPPSIFHRPLPTPTPQWGLPRQPPYALRQLQRVHLRPVATYQ